MTWQTCDRQAINRNVKGNKSAGLLYSSSWTSFFSIYILLIWYIYIVSFMQELNISMCYTFEIIAKENFNNIHCPTKTLKSSFIFKCYYISWTIQEATSWIYYSNENDLKITFNNICNLPNFDHAWRYSVSSSCIELFFSFFFFIKQKLSIYWFCFIFKIIFNPPPPSPTYPPPPPPPNKNYNLWVIKLFKLYFDLPFEFNSTLGHRIVFYMSFIL